jgi:hypothetical protein
MTLPVKTRDVAGRLGRDAKFLDSLLRSGRMPLPAKDSSGQFVWSEEDIANAIAAMKVDRRRKGHRGDKAGKAVAA